MATPTLANSAAPLFPPRFQCPDCQWSGAFCFGRCPNCGSFKLYNLTPDEQEFSGSLIEDLTRTVENVEQSKPPQPDPSLEIISRTDEERRACNAEMLNALWILGEQMVDQAFELPHPKPDPLIVALNGFPDVNTSLAYQAGR